MGYVPGVALVGCGWFACKAHLPALKLLERRQLIRISALCSLSDRSIDRASDLMGRTIARFKSLEELLLHRDFDIVDLTVPIPAMEAAVRACLAAGRHVISEKPCAGSFEGARELLSYHRGLGGAPFWAVAENWRFKPTVSLVHKIVHDGVIGEIDFADFRHASQADPQITAWREAGEFAGGYLLDSGVHFVAMLRQIMGEVDDVSAVVSRRERRFADPDSVAACLRFANGADGVFRLSFARDDAPQRSALTLIGRKGNLTADFLKSAIVVRTGKIAKRIKVRSDAWIDGGVSETLEHCLTSIIAGRQPVCDAAQATADMSLIESMLLSSRHRAHVAPSSLDKNSRTSRSLVRTYERMRDFKPHSMIDCESVDEVRAAIAKATSAGLNVRMRGNGFSWAPHVMTDGVTIGIPGLNRIGTIDRSRGLVRVDAGVRLGALTHRLSGQGLSLPSLSFLNEASVGGAIATATHGTSPRWGTLSDFVETATLVLSSGEIRTIDASSEEDLRAARASVGMLGAVVSLDLRVIPVPFMRYRHLRMDLGTFFLKRAAILEQYAHVWVNWSLGTDLVDIDCLEKCREGDPDGQPYVIGDNALWRPRRRTPADLVRRVASKLRRGKSNRGPDAIWASMQYGVPLSDMEASIAAISLAGFPHEHPGTRLEFKFLAGSRRTMLGPNAEGDTVLFNMWWLVDRQEANCIFDTFEAAMITRKGKPHWGKLHRAPTIAYMHEAYAEWDAFARVKDRFDPSRTFTIFDEERRLPLQEPSLMQVQ